jgi:hypothetical protein
MRHEDLDKPFTADERKKLLAQPCLNDLVKELWAGRYDPAVDGLDLRLWRLSGDEVEFANLNYSGKGIKFHALRLSGGGAEFLEKRLKR